MLSPFPLFYFAVIDRLLRRIRAFLLSFAGMRAGATVLDICCATGGQLAFFAKHGMHAAGIDINAQMLRIARSRVQPGAVSNTLVCRANAGHLPFRDESFDFVSICLALHEKPPWLQEQLVLEARRVTREDGFLVLMDYSAPMPKTWTAGLAVTIEFLAGRQHFLCFRDYQRKGGLKFILDMGNLHEIKQELVLGNALTLVLAKPMPIGPGRV